ncbi:RNA polymerase sigma factor [Chitinophaga sp. sic0106]|uniref:RNA polymerase sigma factor n=1 Tax=Chitinophaga sp. sic0106 TaxID=2854785 RepID=UPI001C455B51|nr:RNA polymerase sigma-70 factor [Chitinophaga sp. sic0106]MBV7533729.1 RNA polymerase sigma-70 factor [Chitinophaga sp. sic0106]
MNNLLSEADLCELLAQGNESAYEELYSRYWKKVYKIALTYLKQSHEAEDLVQNVFIKLWLKRNALAGISSFDAWLRVVARNEVISYMRKQELPTVAIEAGWELRADESHTPHKLTVSRESTTLINNAIEQLPPQRRQVFKLSREEGLTYDQIASRTGIVRETVKKHIVRALVSIRQYLDTNK